MSPSQKTNLKQLLKTEKSLLFLQCISKKAVEAVMVTASPVLTLAPLSAQRHRRKALCSSPCTLGPSLHFSASGLLRGRLQQGPAERSLSCLLPQPLLCCMQVSDTLCCLNGPLRCGAAIAGQRHAGLWDRTTGGPRRDSRYRWPNYKGQMGLSLDTQLGD